MQSFDFITPTLARQIAEQFGTPTYVYSETLLKKSAEEFINCPNAYGFTPRYAMKSSPNINIIKLFQSYGIKIDASSGYEVERLTHFGVPASDCSLSAQELPRDIVALYKKGLFYTLCSLHQLEKYGTLLPGTEIGLRFNPGLGSGHSNRVNTGGPSSSFGIWKNDIEKAKTIAEKYNLKITKIHTHIGSGADNDIWLKTIAMSVQVIEEFPTATILNLGGGFKISRMPDEKQTNLHSVCEVIVEQFKKFAAETDRKLTLELEPGTYLVGNACCLLTTVQDMTSTGKDGYNFLKIDSGMTEIPRPFGYGAQHPVKVIPLCDEPRGNEKYLVVGHCCESGDILTPAPGNPEGLLERDLIETKVGDLLLIGGAGAYCSGMAIKNYNSFPEATEVMIRENGTVSVMRKRQALEQMIINEVMLGD